MPHDDWKYDNSELEEIIKEQNRKEAAHYVQQGYTRKDAVERVNNLNEKRNDPSNYVDTSDDTREYLDSSLDYPEIKNEAQNNAIAKELKEDFE